MSELKKKINEIIDLNSFKDIKNLTTNEIYELVSKAALSTCREQWQNDSKSKKACYLSAEFLVGRLVYSNLLNLGLLEECRQWFEENGLDFSMFEEIDDAALGNGGLGRLAACFLDSAATHNIALDGFGIRYKYGLFKQSFENGFQIEQADRWMRFGDPWSVRRENDSQIVKFKNQQVLAVPYDMPVIGYDKVMINTLRLWQAEPVCEFDFEAFNNQKFDEAVTEKNRADEICSVLYPNDEGEEGKILRLKQQYFFVSATMQYLLKEYSNKHVATDFAGFENAYAVHLNDTHPVLAIPELVRILVEDYDHEIKKAIDIAKKTFAYTNHTILAEALEKWDVEMMKKVIPDVYAYIKIINDEMLSELKKKGVEVSGLEIIEDNKVHMARLAIYISHSVNGVSYIHTEILKNLVLPKWHKLYPDKINNKTNGITQRRWLNLCNSDLSDFITKKLGNDKWITDLEQLDKLTKFKDDKDTINEFWEIKRKNKQKLADYIYKKEGIKLEPHFIFDIQIKRLHEYKRQLLNALSILDTYFAIKEKRLVNFHPTAYIFGAKAAPGYKRAKGIIKFINEIAKLINNDKDVKDLMKVIFVTNYDVSYAEKLIPAAEISEQISTAGKEASGTGNMKLMLNGAVTLGTLDGANIEIVESAGIENNYIFGATVEEIEKARDSYKVQEFLSRDKYLDKALKTLVDGTFSDNGTGIFKELYDSIVSGASWHRADEYFVCYDFDEYRKARIKANSNYRDNQMEFAKKCYVNTCKAGIFSSDRTIKEYWSEIWK